MLANLYYNVRYAARCRKPKLIARLSANVIRAAAWRQSIMRYVDVCVSTRCNLSCVHCFATTFERPGQPVLSLDEWHDIAIQCMRLGCVSFGVTGGEPLLHENLIPLVKHLVPEHNLITVNTNGTLLTDYLAGELYHAGVDVLQFSMDSAVPEEHNNFRRAAGAHQALMRAIDMAVSHRLKVTLVCTVSHQSIMTKGVRELVDFARQRGFLLIISRAVPAGRWRHNLDVLLTDQDRRYLYDLVRRYPHVRTDMDSNYCRYGCSAATEKLYFTPYGDVIPCPFMHITFGNTRKDTVAQIRTRMLSLSRMNSYSHQCLVAEDHDFINNILSKTFAADGLVDWRECFGSSDSSGACPPDQPHHKPQQEKELVTASQP